MKQKLPFNSVGHVQQVIQPGRKHWGQFPQEKIRRGTIPASGRSPVSISVSVATGATGLQQRFRLSVDRGSVRFSRYLKR